VDIGDDAFTEAVSYTFNNVDTRQFDTHIINVGNCSVSGSGDCLSSGESTLPITIADAKFPSFHNNSLLFSSDSSDDIYEYSISTLDLRIVASGNEADSVN
jgi:hypothetical protein